MIYEIRKDNLEKELQKYVRENSRIITIDSTIADSSTFFSKLYEELSFPEYFGFNWAALNDCLCDFCWLKEDYVVIVIKNKESIFAKEPNNERELNFSYLNEASEFWDSPDDEFGYKQGHPNLVFDVYYVEDLID